MYSVYAFGRMIADDVRMGAYVTALERSVRPGSVVVDLGAGTGVFSLLACRLGAAHVYAIETNPAVTIAAESAAANGFADRITCINRDSRQVTLPQPADVLISDLRGALPPDGQHIPSIIDARTRLLRPGGVQIPQSDELWVAPVNHDIARGEATEPWSALGLDMSAALPFAVNSFQQRRIEPDHVVAEPRCWSVIDYRTVENPDVAGSASWQIGQPGRVDGLGLWFTANLLDGVSFSTSCFGDLTIYGMVYAPLAEELELSPGDELEVRLRADLVGDSYVWSWHTDHSSPQGTRQLRQSTFLASPPPLAGLEQRAETARPEVDLRAHATVLVLTLLDGTRTLGDLADMLVQEYPSLFSTRSVALRFAANLADKYLSQGSPDEVSPA